LPTLVFQAAFVVSLTCTVTTKCSFSFQTQAALLITKTINKKGFDELIELPVVAD
jgi:hypothetical protein